MGRGRREDGGEIVGRGRGGEREGGAPSEARVPSLPPSSLGPLPPSANIM